MPSSADEILDVEAVQAFVLVADLKSFTRAAEAMDTTQSVVSLRIKRLEESLGRRLLEHTPRMVRLWAQGTAFLASARHFMQAHQGAIDAFGSQPRRLKLGISHHVVGAELPVLLKRLAVAEPQLVIELHVGTSRDALDGLDRGLLEAAIVLAHDNRRQDGELIHAEPFGWMAAQDFVQRDGEPLRLATQAEPCSVRRMALDALAQADLPWTEVFGNRCGRHPRQMRHDDPSGFVGRWLATGRARWRTSSTVGARAASGSADDSVKRTSRQYCMASMKALLLSMSAKACATARIGTGAWRRYL